MLKKIKILVVEDNPHFLKTLISFIDSFKELEVVGIATSGIQAISLTYETLPDLILMDIFLPGMNGLATSKIIKQSPFAPKIAVMSFYNAAEYKNILGEIHGDYFICKSELLTGFVPMIEKLFYNKISITISDNE